MAKSDEAPWLNAEEQATWFSLIGTLIRLPAALDAQLRRDAGISHFEYQVLAGLSMTETRTMRMSDIAYFAGSSLSRLSHACGRLEAQGWLARHADPDDRRATIAGLTDAGYAKVVDAAPGLTVRPARHRLGVKAGPPTLLRSCCSPAGEIAKRSKDQPTNGSVRPPALPPPAEPVPDQPPPAKSLRSRQREEDNGGWAAPALFSSWARAATSRHASCYSDSAAS